MQDHALKPFPADRDELNSIPDNNLGGRLLAYFIGITAIQHGFDPSDLPEGFAETLVSELQHHEAIGLSSHETTIEKALRIAAKGEWVAAGKLLREYLHEGAIQIKYVPAGVKSLAQKREFGRRGGEVQSEGARERKAEALQLVDEIKRRNPGLSDTAVAKQVEKKLGTKWETVRGYIKQQNSRKNNG